MTHSILFALAAGKSLSNTNPDLDAQNPLTTREMYAVRPNRSVVKSLRRHIGSLFAPIKSH